RQEGRHEVTRAIRKHLGDFIALAALFIIGIAVVTYIISQQESRPYFPLIESKPYKLKAEFSDAQAVVPGQGQTVRVAGGEGGQIWAVGARRGGEIGTMDRQRVRSKNAELVVRPVGRAQITPR